MVKSLGYIGLQVTDLSAWDALLTDQIGLIQSDVLSGGPSSHYRLDGAASRLSLVKGPEDKLSCIGWDVGNAQALAKKTHELESQGVPIGDGEPGLAFERGVSAVKVLSGPDGVRHELFYGQSQAETPFENPLLEGTFKTGSQGLGHAVIAASDRVAAATWYREKLGFKLSDEIMWDDAEATFMRCNARHHSLAVLNCCMGMQPGQLNHIMVEMTALEDVGRAYDRVRSAGTPLGLHIGQHMNDRVVSFYLVTPSGSAIEVGYGGLEVDDATWQPTTFDTPKIWGHDPAEGPAVG